MQKSKSTETQDTNIDKIDESLEESDNSECDTDNDTEEPSNIETEVITDIDFLI